EFDSDGYTRVCELFMLNFQESIPVDTLFERHKAFGDEVESRHQPFTTFAGSRDPERKLRIGYISGDFRAHPVGWGFLPLVENHDRSRHDVYCYSLFAAADDVTRRIAVNITRWHDVST